MHDEEKEEMETSLFSCLKAKMVVQIEFWSKIGVSFFRKSFAVFLSSNTCNCSYFQRPDAQEQEKSVQCVVCVLMWNSLWCQVEVVVGAEVGIKKLKIGKSEVQRVVCYFEIFKLVFL